METRFNKTETTTGRIDPWLLVVTLLLAGIGIVMVYSASFVRAEAQTGSALYYMKRQLVWVGIGVVIMLLLGKVPYRKLKSPMVVYGLFVATVVMLVMVYVPPFGKLISNSHRWLRFGPVQFQPAELAKLASVLLMAYVATALREKITQLKEGVFPMIAGPMVMMALIVPEPDLGSCVVIGAVMIVMLFVAGTRLVFLGGATLLGILGIVGAVIAEPYRIQRIGTFLSPWADKQGKGYQIIQSLIAFGSGGLFGLGLGNGRQKLFYLPAPHTDFIMANMGEELGMAGVWMLLALYCFLLYRAFLVAFRAPDRFCMLLATGLTSLIGLQVVINAMVVMSMLPNKGLALPFMSYGGSSALVNFAVVGLLMAVSRGANATQAAAQTRRAGVMPLGEVAQ